MPISLNLIHISSHICVCFFAWPSVSTDTSLNCSWILKQWHHCTSYRAAWSLDACLCVFLFVLCANVPVHCSIKKKKKVPLCYNSMPSSIMLQGRRQDRANQGWYVHGRGRAPLELHTSMKGNGSKQCMFLWLSYADERLKSADVEGKKRHVTFPENVCDSNALSSYETGCI